MLPAAAATTITRGTPVCLARVAAYFQQQQSVTHTATHLAPPPPVPDRAPLYTAPPPPPTPTPPPGTRPAGSTPQAIPCTCRPGRGFPELDWAGRPGSRYSAELPVACDSIGGSSGLVRVTERGGMVMCDAARVSRSCGRWWLVVGWCGGGSSSLLQLQVSIESSPKLPPALSYRSLGRRVGGFTNVSIHFGPVSLFRKSPPPPPRCPPQVSVV